MKINLLALGVIITACIGTGATAGAPPFSNTEPASHITLSAARLNGMATPNGSAAKAWFEWGQDGFFTHRTSAQETGDGSNVVWVSDTLTNLPPHQIFRYRLVVSNSLAVTYGHEQRFITGGKLAWQEALWCGFGDQNRPRPAQDLDNLVGVAIGYNAVWSAIRADGSIVEWGPPESKIPPDLGAVTAVAFGHTNIALRTDGTVRAWSYSNEYELTNGLTPDLREVVAVSSGDSHFLALTKSGEVVAWGDNTWGQSAVPIGLENVVAIAAGLTHSLALRQDGTVAAWGLEGDKAINVPVGLTNVVAIGAGEGASAALLKDGTVVRWGADPIASATNIAAIFGTRFAIRADGTADGTLEETGCLPPALRTNQVVAIVGSGLTLGANIAPMVATASEHRFSGSSQTVVPLYGTDLNYDRLTYRITQLPERGRLYQFTENGPGEALAPGAVLTDPSYPVIAGTWIARVIFIAESNEYRDPYASFSFVISDNESDSSPAKVNLLSIAPFPRLTIRRSAYGFEVVFGKGQPNTYHIWSSSDLVIWRDLGEPVLWEPGVLSYFEYSTQPAGFYKVIAR